MNLKKWFIGGGLIILLVILGITGGLFGKKKGMVSFFPFFSSKETATSPPTNLGGDFQLSAEDGSVFRLNDHRGKVLLLTFGYTSCAETCPMTLNFMKQIYHQLGILQRKVEVIFISFDPERDHHQALQEYAHYFDSHFIGTTGTLAEVAAVAEKYGTAFVKQTSLSKDDYGFIHTDYVYLIDSSGKIQGLYTLKSPVKELVRTIQQLVQTREPLSVRLE